MYRQPALVNPDFHAAAHREPPGPAAFERAGSSLDMDKTRAGKRLLLAQAAPDLPAQHGTRRLRDLFADQPSGPRNGSIEPGKERTQLR